MTQVKTIVPYQSNEGSYSVRNNRVHEIKKLMSDVNKEQKIMSDMRSEVSGVARDLGLGTNHSENWSSVVAFLTGWIKGYEKGSDY